MPILQCRRCQCYDGCDLVKVSVVTKNLQKYNDQCELVTLEELLNGKMPRCYFDEKPEEPSPSPKPSPSSRPVTRGMKRRNEGEDAVPVDGRAEREYEEQCEGGTRLRWTRGWRCHGDIVIQAVLRWEM